MTLVVDAAAPLPAQPLRTAGVVAGEVLLSWTVLAFAGRTPLRAQVLQALGLLAALRNVVLAPVSLLLLAGSTDATPGFMLAAVSVGLVTVIAMAWLVGHYLALWQQALGRSRRVAGAVVVALALALLALEAALG